MVETASNDDLEAIGIARPNPCHAASLNHTDRGYLTWDAND
jgi:hypothetical protein